MLTIDRKENNRIVLRGRIDSSTLHLLEPFVNETESNLIINLEEVDYINSAGLGVFLAIEQNARKKGSSSSITIENPTPYIEELFKITGLDKLINISGKDKTK